MHAARAAAAPLRGTTVTPRRSRTSTRCPRAASASALDALLGPSVDLLPPRRAELKAALLAAIAPTQRGARASPAQATEVDAAAAALEARSPVANAVGALAGRWDLLYTTERDVHLFCSLPGGASSVSQEVDATRTRVTNRIAWRLLGLQLAAGAPATTSAPKRLAYRFAELRLTASGLPLLSVQLGAEGPGGWSDCTYIDGDTRIARNSRGDLLVLQRSS